jgi:hypothetical protein
VLVGDAPHGFKVVAGLQLPSGNKNAIARLIFGGNGRAADRVVRVRQICSVLLYQFVGDLIAREFVADNQSETVFRREFPLIAQRKTAGGAVVGVILRDHRVEIVARHVPGGAQAKRIPLPCVLVLGIDPGRIVGAAEQGELAVESRVWFLRVLTSTTPPIFLPNSAGMPAV